VLPGLASASTAAISGTSLTVDATTGTVAERNEIGLTLNPVNNYLITDTAGVTPGPGCFSGSPTLVACPDSGVTSIIVNTGPNQDLVDLDPVFLPAGVPARIDGGDSDDVIQAGPAPDTLLGGSGNDALIGRRGADTLSGGPGDEDVATYFDHSAAVRVTVGNGSADDGGTEDQTGVSRDNVLADVEDIEGSPFDDVLRGRARSQRLFGLAGDDTLRGLAGGDEVIGNAGDDRAIGGPGRDLVIGNRGADILKGNGSIDVLRARDHREDRVISCGSGRFETVSFDRRLDPRPISC
jgi:Ca2+-binding RTX toxin-like protein